MQINSESKLSTNPKKYSNTIDRVYPLLNPDIKSEEERFERHAIWFKEEGAKTKVLLTEPNKNNADVEYQKPEDLGHQAPCKLDFIPSKRVFKKLFKRATQIKDEISELNPKEMMNDPRKLKAGEEEEIRMCAVNGAIVYGGLDQKFNELRVFPPFDMDYPDLIKNKENFYDLIGCPHLKEKFEM